MHYVGFLSVQIQFALRRRWGDSTGLNSVIITGSGISSKFCHTEDTIDDTMLV